MLGANLLAARGVTYRWHCACLFDGLDLAGNKTMRHGETCEVRLPLLGTATASPGRIQAKQNAAVRRRLPPGLSIPERVRRSVSGTNAHDHQPIWNFTYPRVASAVQQAAVEIGQGTVTLCQLRHSGASVDTARQYRTLDAVQKRGAWSQAKSMHMYGHSSRIAADYGKLLPEVRTL